MDKIGGVEQLRNFVNSNFVKNEDFSSAVNNINNNIANKANQTAVDNLSASLSSLNDSSFKYYGIFNRDGNLDMNDLNKPGYYLIDGSNDHRKPNHWPFNPQWGIWALCVVYDCPGGSTRPQEVTSWDGSKAVRWNNGWKWYTYNSNDAGQGYTW